MSYFAAVLARAQEQWHGVEVSLDDCETIEDICEVGRDVPGDLRLVLFEQDDEYAVIVRIDEDEEPRAFVSDGHAAEAYALAASIAEDLAEIGEVEVIEDEDTPPARDSAPFGDAEIVEDLGTSAADLIAMCSREGTLPIDLLAAVCEKAGCGETFDELRA